MSGTPDATATRGGTSIIPLTADEQELLRRQALYAVPEISMPDTLAELEADMPRLDLAMRMLRYVEDGVLPCEPEIVQIVRDGYQYVTGEVNDNQRRLDAYVAQGVEGFLSFYTRDTRESLIQSMSLRDFMDDLSTTRSIVDSHAAAAALFEAILSRVEAAS